MVRKMLCLFLVLVCLSALVAGCGEEPEKTVHYCAKCGRTATTTISGSAYSMEKQGIPLSSCWKVTSSVYSAYICASCTGPVATLMPD